MITKSIAVLNSQDVLKAQEGSVPTLVHHEPTNIYGGSFFSSLKSAFTKVHNFLKDKKAISRALGAIDHPLTQKVSKAAEALGYGMRAGAVVTMPNYYEDLEELHTKGGRKRSKSKRRGMKMSRKSLKRRGGCLDENDCREQNENSDEQNEDSNGIYNTR